MLLFLCLFLLFSFSFSVEIFSENLEKLPDGTYKAEGDVEFEEGKYGMLMMVLCDWWGRVYDVWITFGSVHEVWAFRERKKRSLWFRGLVENTSFTS